MQRPLRCIVIGAGLSGIMAAIKLRAAGYDDIVVYEKASRPGGTWRENTYPGIACDIPSHLYSYSFAPNPNWSQRYAPGAEIQRYIEAVAKRFDVERLIRFDSEVIQCRFANDRWQVRTRNGRDDIADVVIAATGVLHHPRIPEIAGIDSFAGKLFHSARFDHQAPLDGRVGIVGTGSTAVQLVSALVSRAAQLVLFQRTAQWIMPLQNVSYSQAEQAQFADDPRSLQGLREMLARRFTEAVSNALIDVDSPAFQAIEAACLQNLESQVLDATLREQLRPSYRAACKRLVVSPDFYQAIQRPNARLVTAAIEAIEPRGVRTVDGRLHELDVLILATGFHADNFMRPMNVIGRDDVRLNDVWSRAPSAHLMVTVPSFPNFFMLNGPGSPVGNFPLIEVAERQMDYALQLIELLRNGAHALSPKPSALQRYDTERVDAARRTVWATGCRSWYLDGDGVPSAWPFSIERFYAEMAAPQFADFEIARRA